MNMGKILAVVLIVAAFAAGTQFGKKTGGSAPVGTSTSGGAAYGGSSAGDAATAAEDLELCAGGWTAPAGGRPRRS